MKTNDTTPFAPIRNVQGGVARAPFPPSSWMTETGDPPWGQEKFNRPAATIKRRGDGSSNSGMAHGGAEDTGPADRAQAAGFLMNRLDGGGVAEDGGFSASFDLSDATPIGFGVSGGESKRYARMIIAVGELAVMTVRRPGTIERSISRRRRRCGAPGRILDHCGGSGSD